MGKRKKYLKPQIKVLSLVSEVSFLVAVSGGQNSTVSNFEHVSNFASDICTNDQNHSCNQDYSEYEDDGEN
jgi:hypothetical protein